MNTTYCAVMAGFIWLVASMPVPPMPTRVAPKAQKAVERTIGAAAMRGDTKMVGELLAGGANVDERDKAGETPLMRAASKGHAETVSFLLSKGADPNFRSDNGSALTNAVLSCNREVIELLLLHGADVNATDRHGITGLVVGSARCQPEVVELLLKKGADSRGAERSGGTALHHASFLHDNPVVARLLLEKGAQINQPDMNGTTPLMFACERGRREMVQLLLSKGADVKAMSTDGSTVLHYASRSLKPDILEALVSLGVEVNAQNREGRTPLMEALRSLVYQCSTCARPMESVDFEGTVAALLEAGADVSVKTKDGKSALSLASQARQNLERDADKVKELSDGYWVKRREDISAVIHRIDKTIQMLRERGAAE